MLIVPQFLPSGQSAGLINSNSSEKACARPAVSIFLMIRLIASHSKTLQLPSFQNQHLFASLAQSLIDLCAESLCSDSRLTEMTPCIDGQKGFA